MISKSRLEFEIKRAARQTTLMGFATLLTALLVVVLSIYDGVVIYFMWTWFMVPLGVLPITVAWAIGLSALFRHMAPIPTPGGTTESGWLSASLLRPLSVLVIGYVAHTFM